MSKSKKFMDVLGLSDDSEADSGSEEEAEPQPAKKPKSQGIDVETLQQHGYTGGLSVLLVPEKAAEGDVNWAWSSGAERRADEPQEETFEERQQTREAVSTKAEESAVYARKAAGQAQRLREEQRAERERIKEEKLTWKQKEKRKRDAGQQNKGKNYIEEEKRKARDFGIYSGFD